MLQMLGLAAREPAALQRCTLVSSKGTVVLKVLLIFSTTVAHLRCIFAFTSGVPRNCIAGCRNIIGLIKHRAAWSSAHIACPQQTWSGTSAWMARAPFGMPRNAVKCGSPGRNPAISIAPIASSVIDAPGRPTSFASGRTCKAYVKSHSGGVAELSASLSTFNKPGATTEHEDGGDVDKISWLRVSSHVCRHEKYHDDKGGSPKQSARIPAAGPRIEAPSHIARKWWVLLMRSQTKTR